MKGKERKEKKSSNLTYNLTRTYFVTIDVYIYITIGLLITRTLPIVINLFKHVQNVFITSSFIYKNVKTP